jgi:hypothetical protein
MRFPKIFIVLLALIFLSLAANSSAKTASQTAAEKQAKLLEKIKAMNLTHPLEANTLTSYRLSVCVALTILQTSVKQAANDCVKGQTGVLATSSAYLKVETARTLFFEVVNAGDSWQLRLRALTGPDQAPPVPAKLEAIKLRALQENIRHSLIAFYQLLNSGSWSAAELNVTTTLPDLIIRWKDSDSVNEYHFDQHTYRCTKQVRRNVDGVTVFKYADYRDVAGVMLPFTIQTGDSTGQITTTQKVEEWKLSVSWPENFFTPAGIVKSF